MHSPGILDTFARIWHFLSFAQFFIEVPFDIDVDGKIRGADEIAWILFNNSQRETFIFFSRGNSANFYTRYLSQAKRGAVPCPYDLPAAMDAGLFAQKIHL